LGDLYGMDPVRPGGFTAERFLGIEGERTGIRRKRIAAAQWRSCSGCCAS